MIENRTVNELLRACRERADMTQQELAALIHIDRSTVAKVELGIIKDPSYSLVRQWCAATQGMDLLELDLGGGMEGWKKLKKLEEMMRTMQAALSTASMLRKSSEGQARENVGTGSSNIRSLFSRIRS